MRKVFIDIGSHVGQSIDQFYEEIPDAEDWKIYAFEPIQYDNLMRHVQVHYNNVVCLKGVVGIRDSETTIYPVPDGGQGASVVSGKLTGGIQYEKGVAVRSIDFIQWFKANIRSDDLVVVKVNIEGGEYELMTRLSEIMPYIHGIWVKLHHLKFEAGHKLEMLKALETFRAKLSQFKTFVFLDTSEDPYRFAWLVEMAHESHK